MAASTSATRTARRQQAVEEALDGGTIGAHVGAHGVTGRRRAQCGAVRRGEPEGEDGAGGVGGGSASRAAAPAAGPRTTTAVSASPRAASTAASQPASMRTRSSSVPTTPACRPGARRRPGPGGVEGQLQSVGPGPAPRRPPLGGRAASSAAAARGPRQLARRAVGPLDVGAQRRLDELARLALVAQLGDRGARARRCVAAGRPVTSAHLGLGPLGGRPPRPQLAAHLGDGARRGRRRRPLIGRAGDAPRRALLLATSALGVRAERGLGAHRGELLGDGRRRLQAGDHAGVEQLAAVALDGPAALGDHGGEAAGPLPQLLGARRGGRRRRRRRAPSARRSAAATSVSSRASSLLSAPPAPPASSLAPASAVEPGAQPGDLPPGDVDAQRRQLADQLAVAAGRLGLALERTQLAAHLAQEVLDAAAGWPRWRRGGARPSPCACGT